MVAPEEDDTDYTGQGQSEWIADLDAPDIETRERAARALHAIAFMCDLRGKSVPSVVVRSLVDALRDPESRVRGEVARALGAVGKQAHDAVQHLMELLGDEDEADRTRALIAEAIGNIGGALEASSILIRLLNAGSDDVREAVAAALESADLSGLGVEDQLRSHLDDESQLVRTWICWSLWKLTKHGGNLVPCLLAAMKDDRARLTAARLLCWMKDQAAIALPELIALQGDENWAIRLQAVRAVIHIPCSDEIALPVLEALRDDPNSVVTRYVASELEKRHRA